MGGWRNSTSSSNGKSNGITTESRSDFNYSHTLQADSVQTVNHSPLRKRYSNVNEDDKVTCSFEVTLRKHGLDQPALTKSFVFETFNLGNLTAEEMKRLEFKKMSFDLKVEEPLGFGGRKVCEGIDEDVNGNACKPLNISGLHFDWSRFTVLPRSLKRSSHSKCAQFVKYLLIFFVFLLVVVGLVLSFDGASFFYSFLKNICIEYQK